MKKNFIRYTVGDRCFLFFDQIILAVFLIVLIYPLLYIFSASFSAGGVSIFLIPEQFTTAGYRAVFEYRDIWAGYANSVFYMVSGTLVSLTVTVCCAYPLSRSDFRGRNIIMVLCMITMYFSGGLIPTYLQVRNLGLLKTRLAVILPGAMSVYNMIVVRTYFKTQVPQELLESAQIDGCGNIRYLLRILLPLSVPILAVNALFCAVGYWNSYFDAMIYLQNQRAKYPLSLFLREILVMSTMNAERIQQMDAGQIMNIQERQTLMKYAVIIVASVPMMIIYPFVQKYFVKGILVGSVKG
ncbi:MAG: carbohydrate ABC transporter permease [Spirochaetaceae bacterium]|jgi:ABC-type glycerol-3-phosphate transport system permease component|nr:carbohydrate ABC transporter permease [Spirochaetaceae bacterium]